MTTPIVTEIPRAICSTSRDTFGALVVDQVETTAALRAEIAGRLCEFEQLTRAE